MISEKARTAFEENKRRRVNLWIRKNNDLLYSVAYRSLDYAPALKVYDWARMKDRIESKTDIRKRKKLGLRKPDPEPFSFTFDEAELFGLTRKQFARAIRELHAVGIIDVVKKGSGKHKDYSLFAWSERWRKYSTDQFEDIPFPARGSDNRCVKRVQAATPSATLLTFTPSL